MYKRGIISLYILLLTLFSVPAFSCGPFFPNSYLMSGDEILLKAPGFNFYEEINRIKIDNSNEFVAVYPTNTIKIDIQELSEALINQRYNPEKIDQIISNYRNIRNAIQQYEQDRIKYQFYLTKGSGKKTEPKITFSIEQIPEEIPDEFSLYLKGVIYYKTGKIDNAIDTWKKIFELPASQKQYRSTWAMYMLGKCTHDQPDIALLCYQKVRQLVRDGFKDSQGLAASSFGQEALVHLKQRQYSKAIELYLIQKQTGDRSAVPSLMFVSGNIFGNCGVEELTELVKHPLTCRVLIAYAISYGRSSKPRTEEQDDDLPLNNQQALLLAIEKANLKSIEQADHLAMIAYQAGNFEKANRWLNIANPDSLISRRVRAKLYLREGKITECAEDLAFIAWQTGSGKLNTSFCRLRSALSEYGSVDTPYKLYSELGSLYISQSMYIQALDALMEGGNWIDAAYIAERVLTPEELKNYIDVSWSTELSEPIYTTNEHEEWDELKEKATEIRYLLARRLTRLQKYNEARAYFPEECLEDFDTFVAALEEGNNTQLNYKQRSDALWTAAWLARHRGIEMMGTELDPDWHIYQGNYEQGKRLDLRESVLEQNIINVPSKEETNRAQKHITLPDKRFHYRYIASELAWEATLLMPDENDETARRLCLAGIWHKNKDKYYADIFYKALVIRCGQTELGKEADRIRWFPKIPDTLENKPHEESQ